jgi:hypothetical protein
MPEYTSTEISARDKQQVPTNAFSGFDQLLQLQFDSPKIKRKPWYGLKLAKSMWTYISYGNNGFYEMRQKQWADNRIWSKGTKDNSDFMSWVGIQGNRAWTNIDYQILKVVPAG